MSYQPTYPFDENGISNLLFLEENFAIHKKEENLVT